MRSHCGDVAVGVSSCLLGNRVRYDGAHKQNDYVASDLAEYVRLVPVCPEVELGLGVPRETLRLLAPHTGSSNATTHPRMVATQSGTDHTLAMQHYARARVAQLAGERISGYIFKKGSPSCGLHRVPVFTSESAPRAVGRGLFAAALTTAMPEMPVEEESRLGNSAQRESFVVRVFAYQRLMDLFAGRWRIGDLVAFHGREKFLLMAYDRSAYRSLGKLVACAKRLSRARLKKAYTAAVMKALGKNATVRKHMSVLQHAAGYFKQLPVDQAQCRLLHDTIAAYHRAELPLIVPTTVLLHLAEAYQVTSLLEQTYLAPHPAERLLRNHA